MPKIALAILSLALCAGSLQAEIIPGPTSFPISARDNNWGIQFTALANSTLTGFDYNHLPAGGVNVFTGQITLKNITQATTLLTINYVPGIPTVTHYTGLNVALHQGDVYQLLATSVLDANFGLARDEVFTYDGVANFTAYPVANTHIRVTSGVYDNLTTGFAATRSWPSFNNITTQAAAAVPEPASLALWSMLSVAGVAAWRRRKNAIAA